MYDILRTIGFVNHQLYHSRLVVVITFKMFHYRLLIRNLDSSKENIKSEIRPVIIMSIEETLHAFEMNSIQICDKK